MELDLHGSTILCWYGGAGGGTLAIRNGGSVSNAIGGLGATASGVGAVTVERLGSTWTSSDSLYVGGSEFSADGNGSLQVLTGGAVDVTNTLKIWQLGSVNLTGATINTGLLENLGTFNFNAGALNIAKNLLMDPAGSLGNAFTITGVHNLGVGGTTTLSGASTLTLDGGTFSTGFLVDNGGFSFNGGTF